MKLNILPFSSASQWFALAIRVFRQRPMFFIGLQSLFFLCLIISMMLGVAGVIFAGPLYIIFLMAIILAAQQIHTGNTEINTGTLFKTLFQDPITNIRMIVLGAFYTLTLFLLSWLSAYTVYLFVTPQDLAVWQELQTLALEKKEIHLNNEQILSIRSVFLFLVGRALVVTSIAQAFFLFTSPLVYWEKFKPVKAIFFSTIAIVKNFKAIIGYFFFTLLLILLCRRCQCCSYIDFLASQHELIEQHSWIFSVFLCLCVSDMYYGYFYLCRF